MITLVHTTTLKKLESIKQYGILRSYSRGKKAAVWLHSKELNAWGETHVKMKHDAHEEGIVHIYVKVSRISLKKHSGELYYIDEHDVSPKSIVRVELVRRDVQVL